MIEILINDIEQAMLNTLNNEQLCQLRKVLEYTFRNVSVTENKQSNTKESNSELVASFISSKSVEGCSENTIAYYRSTINNALLKINKKISHVTTDDLRNYLNMTVCII
ncbi:phage integrase N-terminal SAM-like domain-containing protein [uncultured Prevotella sp.]|uniref:phage integrase N-terminal SAM-like domain-containing protein n=1 Tax=uncultured Prevotella sp. TaxID=159272 RepID=UPI002620B598|nr:phage integrase N-terminal SAM-like domain-containing protein [uncultured Prevotella sp.]